MTITQVLWTTKHTPQQPQINRTCVRACVRRQARQHNFPFGDSGGLLTPSLRFQQSGKGAEVKRLPVSELCAQHACRVLYLSRHVYLCGEFVERMSHSMGQDNCQLAFQE